MSVLVHAVGRSDVEPYPMPDRFKHDIAYFMALPDDAGVPALPAGEFWVRLAESEVWLDDGAFTLVSPLDSASRTEVELSEEHEAWLEWMLANRVEHVRLASSE
jgi:hypothetical protein